VQAVQTNRVIHVVGCHAAGEVGDVVVGGVRPPAGASLWEQSRVLARDTRLKDFLLNEPRGGVFRHINILVPPVHPQAHMGNIILEPETVPPMSGSNTLCVTTVLLETGILEMHEPFTDLVLEMPGGLVPVRAQCAGGRVRSVSFTNLPSYAERLDAPLEVPGMSTLSVDIAFGGDSFVVTDARTLGFSLQADEARELTSVGMAIARAAQEQLGFTHPLLSGMNQITFCMLRGAVEMRDGTRHSTHAVAIKPGKLDRSPTGTGVSARLALMHARGEIGVREKLVCHSILGSSFSGEILEETSVAERPAVLPRITGSAWITETRQLMLAPDDPWPTGYRLADTWPSHS
jgi:proline racemase